MLRVVVLAAGLQSLPSGALGQGIFRSFSADAAVAIDVQATGEAGARPGAENTAAAQVSGSGDMEITVSTSGSSGTARASARGSATVSSGPADPAASELERQDLRPVGTYLRTCDCDIVRTVVVDDIRDISNEFCADGNAKSATGLSNMVWGFGQFLDHDLALSIENEDSSVIEVETETDVMGLHRAVTTRRRGCRNTLNVHTPLVDAGPVYGSDEAYTQNTLREPGTCFMRAAEGGFLPVTTSADDNGRFFFIAGDVRVSEHAFLASQHTVWLREHNRLCEEVNRHPRHSRMSADGKFDLVRHIVIAKFQQVVLEEFLPALGITQADLEAAEPIVKSPGISVEFSIAYRLGHDLIGNDVGGIDIARSFNAESFFLDSTGPATSPKVTYKASAEGDITNIMTKLSTTTANEIDGKLSDALRNFLFGHGEAQDLAGRNIFRGRELGVPTYAGMAKCFGITPDATVEAETPDAWVGLLREPKAAGEPLPPTLRAILIEQFHRSFFDHKGLYWKRVMRRVGAFADEVADSTYAKIIAANTGAKVSGNVFKA